MAAIFYYWRIQGAQRSRSMQYTIPLEQTTSNNRIWCLNSESMVVSNPISYATRRPFHYVRASIIKKVYLKIPP